MHPLSTSAHRKLARGIEQIETLRRETQTFENDDSYVFRIEKKPRSAKEVKHRCFAIERQAPLAHWPLLAGEAIQNLRSALDHAVSASARGKSTRRQYPIFTDRCRYEVIGRGMLPGVPAPIRAGIEETQPYRRFSHAPAKDALEQLRTLSNLDKHRTLSAFAAVIFLETWSHGHGVNFSIEEWASDKQLGHGETKLSELTVFAEEEPADMDVNPEFSYQVRIEGKPLDFFPVIARRVFEAVWRCENGGQPPPFSAYPL